LDISGKIEIISRFKNVKHQSWKWWYSSSSPHKDLKGANCARSMPDTKTPGCTALEGGFTVHVTMFHHALKYV